MNKQPVSYFQTDKAWSNISYSAKGESTTIGRAGCGPTAMAMVLATWADKNVTPKTECAWALEHGFKAPHQGTYYGYFVPAAKRYGLVCRQITPGYIYGNANSPYHAEAKKALDNGDLVIACMGNGTWTRSGHFVLVWGVEGNIVYINDPASKRTVRTRGDYSLFKKQVKLYWVIQCPKDKREEPDMTDAQVRKIVKEENDKLLVTISKMISEATKGLSAPIIYKNFEDLPTTWGKPAVAKLRDAGVLKGTGTGLNISYDMLRILEVLDKAGVFDGVGRV